MILNSKWRNETESLNRPSKRPCIGKNITLRDCSVVLDPRLKILYCNGLELCKNNVEPVITEYKNYLLVKGVKYFPSIVYLVHNGISYSQVRESGSSVTFRCLDKRCSQRIIISNNCIIKFFGHRDTETHRINKVLFNRFIEVHFNDTE